MVAALRRDGTQLNEEYAWCNAAMHAERADCADQHEQFTFESVYLKRTSTALCAECEAESNNSLAERYS